MKAIEQLKALTGWHITSILGAFLATVAPGLLIIFMFEPSLVMQLDWIKLFVLSAAITLPVVAVNAFIVATVGPFIGSIGSGQGARKHLLFWHTTWAFVAFYSAILLAHVFHLNSSQFMTVVTVTDILFGVLILLVMRFFTNEIN